MNIEIIAQLLNALPAQSKELIEKCLAPFESGFESYPQPVARQMVYEGVLLEAISDAIQQIDKAVSNHPALVQADMTFEESLSELDLSTNHGVLDMRNSLKVTIDWDDDAAIKEIQGEFPCVDGDYEQPYRFGVIARDQDGRLIELTTDMDGCSLVAELYEESK